MTEVMFDMGCESFREELKENIGRRVTIFWNANGQNACTTGVVVEVGCDFVEVRGLVPIFEEERPESCDQLCEKRGVAELETVIRLESVTAFVERVPHGHKATVPICCFTLDPAPKQS